MTNNMLLIAVFLIVLLAVAKLIKNKRATGKSANQYPYQKRPYLFTHTERSFLDALEQATEGQYRIIGKVRLADIIYVTGSASNGTYQKAADKIHSRHLDFVACDPGSLAVIFAVQLDDEDHDDPKKRYRDHFIDNALQSAGIPFYRFSAQDRYSIPLIRETIMNHQPKKLPYEALKEPT